MRSFLLLFLISNELSFATFRLPLCCCFFQNQDDSSTDDETEDDEEEAYMFEDGQFPSLINNEDEDSS